MSNAFPILTVTRPQRFLRGHPWVYSNEILMDPQAKSLSPGTIVRLVTEKDNRHLGIATFNVHSLIAARLLTYNETLSKDWLSERLLNALQLRERFFSEPYYRLAHAEADHLPGLIIDRFGDIFVCQINTAGMELLQDLVVASLETIFHPQAIVLKKGSPVRELEGLSLQAPLVKGEFTNPIQGFENGIPFLADLLEGQKTGWFFDQRDNRALVSRLCTGKTVLDCYTYTGGFALSAASAGAKSITAIDRSASALNLARQAMQNFHVPCTFVEGDVLQILKDLPPQSFDVVILDPPAFVKSRKTLVTGLKGYVKLVRLAASLVSPKGFMAITSCSQPVTAELLQQAVAQGLHLTGRSGKILKQLGASLDHPQHPFLMESSYLKGFLLEVES